MLATCVLHLLGYNRFSSGFNFPLSPSPSVPCKNREKPHSCVFSPKKVFHTLIKSAKKDILGYPHGNALLAWLSWKWEKQRHLEVEDRQQSTLNHLIAGISFLLLRPFSTCREKTCYTFMLPPGKLG